jgi:hypothetical protein
MYLVIIDVYNKFGECEESKTFSAKTKAAASMLAGKWCIAGWGHSWKETSKVKKWTSDIDSTIIHWEIS